MLALGIAAAVLATLVPGRPDISADAKKYLDSALDIIEKHSIKRDTDWKKMRQGAYAKAADARTAKDTYQAIQYAVAFLDDHHSDFFPPRDVKEMSQGVTKDTGFMALDCYVIRVAPGGPADKAGLKVGMRILQVNNHTVTDTRSFYREYWDAMDGSDMVLLAIDRKGNQGLFSLTPKSISVDDPPASRLLEGKIGYLAVPQFEGNQRLTLKFANAIQDRIRSLDVPGLKGWIVDLRLNQGGNMWPMLAGLGPLLDHGDLGSFESGSESVKWSCKDGKAMAGSETVVTIKPYRLKHSGLPIAVLTGGMTASSGEAIAISFVGMPNATLIGSPTQGLTTANNFETLSDGAIINLCEAVDADRTGKKYGVPIEPNIRIDPKWALYLSEEDPAIIAAKRWIEGKK